LATLRWLRRQPWHQGPIGMTGESYLGLVQWAVAADADDDLAALSIHGSASQFHGQSYPGGSMSLETSAQWLVMIGLQKRGLVPLPMARACFGFARFCLGHRSRIWTAGSLAARYRGFVKR